MLFFLLHEFLILPCFSKSSLATFEFFQCDGVSLELAQGPPLQGLALLNIPFTHGGTNMWGGNLSRRRNKRQPKKKKTETSSPTANLSAAVQGSISAFY
jgi:hypothetical protein